MLQDGMNQVNFIRTDILVVIVQIISGIGCQDQNHHSHISRRESDRMPERKQMVHFCAKCGKEMSYKEKKMIYIYDVIHKKHFASSDFCPKKRMAINLCADCCYEIEKIICEWKGE